MKVLVTNPRGFCAGVVRAIDIVELAIKKYGQPVYVKHQIVHNPNVVQDVEHQGAITVEEIKEIPDATTLAVKRGFSRTIKAEHIENTKVNKWTTADDSLIEVGDDFGFNETSSIFTDSLQFNPATRTDSWWTQILVVLKNHLM